MERKFVSSSCVAAVGYDERAHVLEVEFKNGSVYRYLHVPAAAHRLLLQSASIGEYVNSVIKPRFEAERVSP